MEAVIEDGFRKMAFGYTELQGGGGPFGGRSKSQNLGKYVWVGAGHGSLWLEPGEMK